MTNAWKHPLAAGLVLACLSTGAPAQEPIKLKVAGVLPTTHFMVTHGAKVWMDTVTKMTNGRVQFEHYPAQQLGAANAMLGLVSNGVVDIAEQPVAYVAEKVPLSGVVELPGMFDTSCQGTAGYRPLVQPGGILHETDFKQNKVRVLMSFMFPVNLVFTAKKAVRSLDDFKGLKLRTLGGATEMVADRLGAVSVRLPAPDIFQSLSRGTIDGAFFSYLSTKAYDLHTVATNATAGFSFGTGVVPYMIGDRAWARLPKDVQDIMLEAGLLAEKSFCSYVDANEAATGEELKKNGMIVTTLDAGQKAALGQALATVSEQWADSLEKRGKPAKQALSDFRKALGH